MSATFDTETKKVEGAELIGTEEFTRLMGQLSSDDDGERDSARLTLNGIQEYSSEVTQLDLLHRIFSHPSSSLHYLREDSIKRIGVLLDRQGGQMVSSLGKTKLDSFSVDILEVFHSESDEEAKAELANAIEKIATSRKDKWPELRKFLQDSFASTCKNVIINSILGSDVFIRKSAIKALMTFISSDCNLDDEMMNTLKKLAPILITIAEKDCLAVIYSDNDQTCDSEHATALECLYAIVLDAPIVVDDVERIFPVCTMTMLNSHDCKKGDSRHTALQMLTILSEDADRIPEDLIPDIVTSCLLTMDDSLSGLDNWLSFNPAVQQFKRTSQDSAMTNGYWYMGKIGKAIGWERMGADLTRISESFLKGGDWKKRAAALIGWSVVGKKFRSHQVPFLIDAATIALTDDHPRVRNAAAHLLADVFCCHTIDDQTKLQKVLDGLVALASDSIPRVRTTSVMALLFLRCHSDKFTPHYTVLLPLLLSIVGGCPANAPNIFHKAAVDLLSTLSLAVEKDQLMTDLPEIERVLCPLFTTLDRSKHEQLFEDAILICRVINEDCELMRILGLKVESEVFYRVI